MLELYTHDVCHLAGFGILTRHAGLDVLDASSGEHVLRACALPVAALTALQPFITRSAAFVSTKLTHDTATRHDMLSTYV